MIEAKQKLVPVSVPWQISPSVPNLKLKQSADGYPMSATFIGHFKCDENVGLTVDSGSIQVISDDPDFEPTPLSLTAPFRMVRVNFVNAYFGRSCQSVSDSEVIAEDDYDWSDVASSLMPHESIEENFVRIRDLWLSSGICPDPGMYEVRNSHLLSEFTEQSNELRHYIMLGHDEYIEVLTNGWSWEAGQPVS